MSGMRLWGKPKAVFYFVKVLQKYRKIDNACCNSCTPVLCYVQCVFFSGFLYMKENELK